MCFLGVCVADRFPREHLMTACEANADGFGYAFTTRGGIEYCNTFNADEAVTGLEKLCKRYPDGVGIFHARWATHGATSLENCHPFVVNDKTVLAHNGVLPLRPSAGDTRSDTAIFASEVMPEWLHTLDTGEIATLEQWAAGNKVALLTCDKRLRDSIYILNESLGHWRGGCWYSNDSYLPARRNWFKSVMPRYQIQAAPKVTDSGNTDSTDSGDTLIKCDFCLGFMSIDDDWCPNCYTCWQCGRLDCRCDDDYLDSHALIAEFHRARSRKLRKVS